MSGQTFAFPPPPPPPPRRANVNHNSALRGRGQGSGPSRGRGGFAGGRGQGHHVVRGRGRGAPHGQLSQQVRSSRTSEATQPHGGSSNSPHKFQTYQASSQQKRDHTTAFGGDALRRSRPTAAPAVPSFSANLADLLPQQSSSRTLPSSQQASKERTKNALGLTPANVDHSESEDDEEEETRLAHGQNGQNLHFSYRGETATLRTAADIAAWIAERKRRYPTQAKREAAQKAADEKRKRWEAEKQARMDAARLAKESRRNKKQQSRQISGHTVVQTPLIQNDPARIARIHAERLRRRALKAQRDLAAAEAALEKHLSKSEPTVNPLAADPTSDDDSIGTISDSSDLSSDSDSSRNETDSDDDAPPEVQSSKTQVPSGFKNDLPASRIPHRPCTAFTKTGKCRFGARCRYSHERNEPFRPVTEAQTYSKGGRKGLFQVMVEKEKEEEQRRVLSAVIALGQQGVLDQPS